MTRQQVTSGLGGLHRQSAVDISVGGSPPVGTHILMSSHRTFVDSFGFSWQVWELAPDNGADARPPDTGGWLYFFSRGTTRRLRDYPPDWAARSWVDLEDFCVRAEVLGAERLTRLVRHLERGSLSTAAARG
jgi:hypothetical protein